MSLLNPFPLDQDGGLLVGMFCALLLLGLFVAGAQELLLWLRALRVAGSSTKVPASITTAEQVTAVAAAISGSSPILAPSADKLAQSAYARDGRMFSGMDPRSLFRPEQLRAKGGGVVLSPAVLEGMPRLLLGLGLAGFVGGTLLALESTGSVNEALQLGGRAALWGLLANVVVASMHGWSSGAGEQAVHKLIHALDRGLARGTDADVLQQLVTLQQGSTSSLAAVEKAVLELASMQKTTVDEAVATRRAIDDLGKGINDAFLVSVVDKLDPTLREMQRLSSENTSQTRRFVETATTAQSDGVARIVDKVMDQLDEVIGGSLRHSAEVLGESAEKQRDTMTRYNESMGTTRELVEDLRNVGEELTRGAERMQQATEPAKEAATAFLETARRLEHVLPHVIDASDAYLRSKDALDHASSTLASQTSAYHDAAELVRKMVAELEEAQAHATTRVAQGVDEAVMGPMREAGNALENFAEAQKEGLGTWQKSTRSLNDTVAELAKATAQLNGFASDLEKAYEPSIEAAQSFREASESLKATVPEIEKIGTIHREAAVAIDSAAVSAGRSILETAQTSSQAISAASAASAKAIRDAAEASAEATRSAGEASAVAIKSAADHSAAATRAASHQGAEALTAASKEGAKAVRQAAVASSDIIETASRSGTEQLEAAVGQAASLIRDAGESSSGAISSSSKSAADAIRASSRANQDAMEEMAEKSAAAIQSSAESAATLITRATENSTESMEHAARNAGEAIERAREAVDGGADGYLKAAGMVRAMVSELQEVHEQAIVRVSAGIDEALGSSLRDAGSHLEGVNDSQKRQLEAWQQLMDTFAPTVDKMGSTASDLDGLVQRYADSARPATAAAEAFGEAARNAANLMPRMDDAVKSYQQINGTLVEAAAGLATSSQQYADAGRSVSELVDELSKVMDSNRDGQQALVDSMSKATLFVDSLGPASESVKNAAIELHQASQETAKVVGDIRETVVVQGKAVTHMKAAAGDMVDAMKDQNQQFLALMNDMDRLEGTITKGVSLLTEQLPRSVDETVVSFDAALAEGVERLGSAVERLRESMDDLQERLDLVMSRK